uniref:Uncharacterized protein n=1 Tax=Caenorhabditis japonica TaxID=281687 RepID=A0A8R1IRL0_CAEJA
MPLLVLIVPLSWIGLSVGLTLYNQTITNICFVVIAFHGLISTLVMLLIHKPYRDVCLGVFCINSAAKLSKQTSPKFLSRRDSMRTTCI